jgi:ketosteroid isomerase-like protein
VDEHPNIEASRRGYDAFAAGEQGAGLPLADDVVWNDVGHNARTGVFRGKEAVLTHVADVMAHTNQTLVSEPKVLAGAEEYVFAIERVSARRGDRALDARVCTVCRLRDSNVAEIRAFPFDATAWDEFWS